MFYFRVDANKHIATGHVMRCLSIAQELKRRGEDCTFITADTESFKLINSWDFNTISLNSSWDKLELEIDTLHQIIKTRNIKRLFVDSYYATDFYLAELSKFTNIIYLDDLGLITNPVHTIINYNNYADTLGYKKRFEKNNVKLLLGSQYVPLRQEFQKVESVFKKEVKNILITTGGGDIYNVAGSIISQISLDDRFDKYKFHIVSGTFNKNLESFENIEEKIVP